MASDEELMQDGEEELNQQPEIAIRELGLSDMPNSLSLLCKVDSGLAHAYVKLSTKAQMLTSIELVKNYPHLRYVDLSDNSIDDLSPLNILKSLLWLKLNNNRATTARLDTLPYLQVMDLSNNNIQSVIGIEHPLLEQLNLNNNKILSCEGLEQTMLPSLQTLQLRANALTNTSGVEGFASLKYLFIGNNKISSLEGISSLSNLEILHCRENQIVEFGDSIQEGCLKNLKYINLRANSVASLTEIQKLSVLPSLEAIVLLENPIVEEEEYRLEVLIRVRRLTRLDKDPYDEDEREQVQERAEMMEMEENKQKQND